MALRLLSRSKQKTADVENAVPDNSARLAELEALSAALRNAYAQIEFEPDGTIVDANSAFLDLMGYSLQEIVGKHHRLFVDPADAAAPSYRSFWERLANGTADTRIFKRITKSGREVCLQSTYLPVVVEDRGAKRVLKVVKYASDITQQQLENVKARAQLEAIGRSQAVIEFEMDGTILWANDNFLATMGYRLDEIRGKNHRMFLDASQGNSQEYSDFWQALRRGEYFTGDFRRIGKGGNQIWIRGTYNPILDPEGKPVSVIKFATDVTEEVNSQNISDSVAESTEQMVETINEISQRVSATAELASSAQSMASSASEAVMELDNNSVVIEKVVEVIRRLADQTNLLALNATIESARAGEAGRGFSVVANEVKELARQTSDATQSIETSVKEIRGSIAGVVASAESITRSVSEVDHNMSSIAAAVEEQSVTTAALSETAKLLQKR